MKRVGRYVNTNSERKEKSDNEYIPPNSQRGWMGGISQLLTDEDKKEAKISTFITQVHTKKKKKNLSKGSWVSW